MTTTCRHASVAFFTWLTISSAAGAGLLNGDFESPVEPGGGVNFDVAPPGFIWIVASNNIEHLTAAYWQPSSGSQSVDLSGADASSIYQDFTFSSAGTWVVTFDMSANPDLFSQGDGLGSGFKTMRVDFGTPSLMTTLGTYSLESDPRSIGNMDYVAFTTPQVTVSDSVVYRLQFTSLNPGNAGPVLDNVQLQLVPEPGTASLLCGGLIGWLVSYRRKGR